MSGYDKVVDALQDLGLVVPSWGAGRTTARCPAHPDNRPSLSVGEADDGTVLLYCFAGCDWGAIVDALGLEPTVLFPDGKPRQGSGGADLVASYTYTDEAGNPLYRKQRFEPKGFTQQRYEPATGTFGGPLGDVRRVLFQLPRVMAALEGGSRIYICEGEKDVITFDACATGVVATTAGGTNDWRPEFSDLLGGASEVLIVVDDDKPGRDAAERTLASLRGAGVNARLAYPAHGKDATDHFFAGFGVGDFLDWPQVTRRDSDPRQVDEGIRWIAPPILARETLVWAYGSEGSSKSMYLAWLLCRLTRQGYTCAYYGEEMSRSMEADRFNRLRPDYGHLRWYNGLLLDLTIEEQVEQIISENRGVDVIVFDSYEKVWRGGRANENRRAADCAKVLSRVIKETGATVIMVDHTSRGFWQDGTYHEPTRPKEASAKEQQSDMMIQFSPAHEWRGDGPSHFVIENTKPARLGNYFREHLRVEDTPDGGLDIVTELGHTPDNLGEGTQAAGETTRGGNVAVDVDPSPGTSPAFDKVENLTPAEVTQLKKMRLQGIPRDERFLIIASQRLINESS